MAKVSNTALSSTEARIRELRAILREAGLRRALRDPLGNLSQKLTPPQIHTMMWLWEDGSLPLSTIAQRVGCSAPTITGVVDRLERLKMCQRIRDTADRRVVLVQLTREGERMARKIDAALQEKLGQFFEALGPADGDTLLQILRRLLAKLGAGDKKEARAS
jgi:DNA-binding MarR family transcriptional regulator